MATADTNTYENRPKLSVSQQQTYRKYGPDASNLTDPKTGKRLSMEEAKARGPLTIPGWNTSGVGPGSKGYTGSFMNGGANYGMGTKRPAGEAERNSGRTSGLAGFNSDQRNLAMERSARSAIDPVSGLSQAPTEAEITAQLNMLGAKGSEFPGYGGAEEQALMRAYYDAKQGNDPAALAAAAQAVTDFKDKLNALRGAEASPISDGNLDIGSNTVPSQSGTAAAPAIAAPSASMGRTVGLMNSGSGAPVQPPAPSAPSGGLEPSTLIPELSGGRTAGMVNRTMETPYGKASVKFGPRETTAPTGEVVRTAPATFNFSDTYDPNFSKKVGALDEASAFRAAEEMPRSGEGYGFEAVTKAPEKIKQEEMAKQALDERAQRVNNWMPSIPTKRPPTSSLIGRTKSAVDTVKGVGQAAASGLNLALSPSYWADRTKRFLNRDW